MTDVLTRDPATPDVAEWRPAAEVLAISVGEGSELDQRLDELERERVEDDAEQEAAKAEVAALYEELQALALRPDDDTDEEAQARIDVLLARIVDIEGQIINSPNVPAPSTNDITLYNVLPLGGSDDARLTEALRLQALDPARVIRLDYRDHGRTFTRTNTYNGKPPRIVGPCMGLVNPEQGVKPPVLITVNVGIGNNAWFVGQGTTFNVLIAGVAIKSDNANSQLIHHPYSAGTAYAATFHDVTLYGFKHGWGVPGDGFAATLCKWSGAIQFPGIKDTALTLRGSDNWYTALTNLDGILGGGKYHVRLESWTKSHMSNMYITARDNTRGVYNESSDTSAQGGTYLTDCVIEGHNAGDPCHGALIVNKSGHLFITNTPINFGMSWETPMDTNIDTALVRVLAGKVSIVNTSTSKASLTGSSVPFAHVSAGDLHVTAVFAAMGGSTPVVRQTGSGRVNPLTYSLVNV